MALADSGTHEVHALPGVLTHVIPLIWNSLPPDYVRLVLLKPQHPSSRRLFLSILSRGARQEFCTLIPCVLACSAVLTRICHLKTTLTQQSFNQYELLLFSSLLFHLPSKIFPFPYVAPITLKMVISGWLIQQQLDFGLLLLFSDTPSLRVLLWQWPCLFCFPLNL